MESYSYLLISFLGICLLFMIKWLMTPERLNVDLAEKTGPVHAFNSENVI